MGPLPCGAGPVCCGHGVAALPAALCHRPGRGPLYLRPGAASALCPKRADLLGHLAAYRPGLCRGRQAGHCAAAGRVSSGRCGCVCLGGKGRPARMEPARPAAGQLCGQPGPGGLHPPRRLLVSGYHHRHNLPQHNVHYAGSLCAAGRTVVLPRLAGDRRQDRSAHLADLHGIFNGSYRL